ncbi:MAG: DUF1127 domain-containing protein [Pikeienuella sp.]
MTEPCIFLMGDAMSLMDELIGRDRSPRSFDGGLARLGLWRRVARERRRLAEMPAEMLKDIGLTPGEAAREANRPFWDIGRRR